MYGKLQGIVQLGQPDEKNNGQIAGIHLEVEKDLQIVQDSIADVVGLINDDDRRFLFFYGQALDLVLDRIEVLGFPVCRLRAQRCSQIPFLVRVPLWELASGLSGRAMWSLKRAC